MPALAKPSPWASVSKEIPALFARQLRDNDIPWHNKPSASASSGGEWYKSKKFWIVAGVLLGIALLIGVACCAAGSSKETEPTEEEYATYPSEIRRKERIQEERDMAEAGQNARGGLAVRLTPAMTAAEEEAERRAGARAYGDAALSAKRKARYDRELYWNSKNWNKMKAERKQMVKDMIEEDKKKGIHKWNM